jgi:hypothetical protein
VTLHTMTQILGSQTDNPIKLVSTYGTIDTDEEMKVFSHAALGVDPIEADEDDSAKCYVGGTNNAEGVSFSVAVTIGTWVNWFIKTPATDADLAEAKTTGSATT